MSNPVPPPATAPQGDLAPTLRKLEALIERMALRVNECMKRLDALEAKLETRPAPSPAPVPAPAPAPKAKRKDVLGFEEDD